MTRGALRSAPPTVLVTGASRGLGATLTRFYAARAARLVIDARGAAALEEVAGRARDVGAEVVAVPGDVTDPEHREALVSAVERLGGRLDLLVLNAGTLGPSPLPALLDADPTALRAAFDTNVVAPLALLSRLRGALHATGGRVVAITSDAAVGAYPGWGVYGASKAALELAVRTVAAENGFAATLVDPGDMRTAMQQAAFPDEDIGDRPLPEATLPFFAWLEGRADDEIDGRRFEAQGRSWDAPVGATTP